MSVVVVGIVVEAIELIAGIIVVVLVLGGSPGRLADSGGHDQAGRQRCQKGASHGILLKARFAESLLPTYSINPSCGWRSVDFLALSFSMTDIFHRRGKVTLRNAEQKAIEDKR
jgi:hypothetical protein